MRFRLYAWLFLFFIITQGIGIMVANAFLEEDLTVTLISEDKDDPINAVFLIGYILFVTAVFLFIMKYFKSRVFYLVEALAVFSTTTIVIEVFFPGIGVMFGLLLVSLRYFARDNTWLKNIASGFAVVGAGSLIGVSLGVLPVILFIVLLAIYDLIAVFKTKHMVKMAKVIVKENLAFTFTIPTKEHSFQLGTGDLVIPLVFGVAVYSHSSSIPLPFSLLPVAMIFSASILGLVGTLHICAEKKIALPALPLQTLFMVISWVYCLVLGMPII